MLFIKIIFQYFRKKFLFFIDSFRNPSFSNTHFTRKVKFQMPISYMIRETFERTDKKHRDMIFLKKKTIYQQQFSGNIFLCETKCGIKK